MERNDADSIDHDETAADDTGEAPKPARRGFYPADRLQGVPRARFAGAGRANGTPA